MSKIFTEGESVIFTGIVNWSRGLAGIDYVLSKDKEYKIYEVIKKKEGILYSVIDDDGFIVYMDPESFISLGEVRCNKIDDILQ